MNLRLTAQQLAHLKTVGTAIDGGLQPTVFDGGFVGIEPSEEEEDDQNVSGRQEARSAARSWPGRRARARGAQAARHPFRSDALESTYGAEFRFLAQHYEALAVEGENGLWVAATSTPLGVRGPGVHFLVALPADVRLAPRAWAFERIGPNAKLMSLKHTNFPDASVCAFPQGQWPWPNPDGLTGLIDIYTLWAIRKLHRDCFGWWPGPQLGSCAYYRLKEFDPREDCGCGSRRRYGQCHMGTDLLLNSDGASAEFKRLFACDYGDRRPPKSVIDAARTRWEQVPVMAEVFARRPDPSGLCLL